MPSSRNPSSLMLNWIVGFVKIVARLCQSCWMDLLKFLHVYLAFCQTPSWNLTRILNWIHSWQNLFVKNIWHHSTLSSLYLEGKCPSFTRQVWGGGHSDVAGLSWVANDGPITPGSLSRSCCSSWLNAQVCLVYTRPIHKNLFLEFPKMPGSFMLHFDR